jgi:hypothetical protein
VETLEERIAPGIGMNRCETVVGSPNLDIEVLEERIAPGFAFGSVNLSGYTSGGSYTGGYNLGSTSLIELLVVVG